MYFLSIVHTTGYKEVNKSIPTGHMNVPRSVCFACLNRSTHIWGMDGWTDRDAESDPIVISLLMEVKQKCHCTFVSINFSQLHIQIANNRKQLHFLAIFSGICLLPVLAFPFWYPLNKIMDFPKFKAGRVHLAKKRQIRALVLYSMHISGCVINS